MRNLTFILTILITQNSYARKMVGNYVPPPSREECAKMQPPTTSDPEKEVIRIIDSFAPCGVRYEVQAKDHSTDALLSGQNLAPLPPLKEGR